MLGSPNFLYRTEFGDPNADRPDGLVRLTPEELASAVSYTLTHAPPDASLLAAARDGSLDDPAVLEQHVRRLVQDPAVVAQFVREQFEIDRADTLAKDPAAFPEFSDAVGESMYDSLLAFVDHVMVQDDGRFETLLTASYGFVDSNLAGLYGVPQPEADGLELAELGPDHAGFLTQMGMMSALARDFETDIVHRGLYVREELLCGTLPPPPPDADAFPPEAR